MENKIDGDLLGALLTFQELARSEEIANAKEAAVDERKRTDVTGRWWGYTPTGAGLVLYNGTIYEVEIMSSTCRPKYSPVNLRRTPTGNYADWQ